MARTQANLCENVGVLSGKARAGPGGSARYAILLRASGVDVRNVTVVLGAIPASAAPHFTVCPSGHAQTCTISTIRAGQAVDLQAALSVPASATSGEQISLTAEATAARPALAVRASATVTVVGPVSRTPAHSSRSVRRALGAPGGEPSAILATRGVSLASLPLVIPGPPLLPGAVATIAAGDIWSSLPWIPAAALAPLPAAGADIGPHLPLIRPAIPSPAIAQAPARGGAEPAGSVTPLGRYRTGAHLLTLAALFTAIGLAFAAFAVRKPRLARSSAQAAGGRPVATASPGAPAHPTAGGVLSHDAGAVGPAGSMGGSAAAGAMPADFTDGSSAADRTGGSSAADFTGGSPAAGEPREGGVVPPPVPRRATPPAEGPAASHAELIRLGINVAVIAAALLALHRLVAGRSLRRSGRAIGRGGLGLSHRHGAMPARRRGTMFPRR